jgi:hypothetical protein
MLFYMMYLFDYLYCFYLYRYLHFYYDMTISTSSDVLGMDLWKMNKRIEGLKGLNLGHPKYKAGVLSTLVRCIRYMLR